MAIGCYLPVGSIVDPPGREGLVNFVSRGIGSGTSSRSKETLDEAIDFVGGSYQFSAGMEGSSGGMQFLAEHLPLALDILADTLRNSDFPEDEFQRDRTLLSGQIQAQLERPGDLCERQYVERLLAHSPYGHNTEGDVASVEALSRDDCFELHYQHFRPDNFILTLAGAFEPAATLAAITERFAAWIPGAPAPNVPALPAAPIGIVSDIIDRPVQQANIRLGFPTISRLHPDYYPLLMANYILGSSSLSSRIATTVRDNQGLAYQVVSRYVPMRHLGIFTVVLQTSNATANRALEGVQLEIVKMQQEVVQDSELDDARSHFRDRFPLTIETNGAMASQLLNIARYDLPLTHFRDHLDLVAAVTKEDILRASQTYLTPGNFVLTVVANAAEARIDTDALSATAIA